MVSIGALIGYIAEDKKCNWVLLLLAGWCIWSIIHGATAYRMALNNHRVQAEYGFQMNENIRYSNFTSNNNFMWMQDLYIKIKKLTNNDDPVLIVEGSQAMIFKHLTNATVKRLPLPLNRSIMNRINEKHAGALIITTYNGISNIQSYCQQSAVRLSAFPELLQYNILIVELPLANHKCRSAPLIN